VEAERERAHADHVADERMASVGREHLGARDAWVEPRVAGIVHEHPPHRLGEGVDERDGSPAMPLLPHAPAGRNDVEDDDLAVLQTPELVGGQPDQVGLRGRSSDNEQGDE